MIVTVDLFDVVIIVVGGVLLLICGVILAVESIKSKRKKK